MSNLDDVLEVLNLVQKERFKHAIELIRIVGQLEAIEKIDKSPAVRVIATLGKKLVMEMDIREDEDLAILEVFSYFMKKLANEIDSLRNLIKPLTSKDESLAIRLGEIENQVKARLKFDEKLDKYLEERTKEREKTREEVKKAGFYI